MHTRALYDMNTQQSLSWDVADSSIPCGKSTFSGSWGDPFEDSVGLLADVYKQNPRLLGTGTIHGMTAKILEASDPDHKTKVWVDTKSGLLLKALSIPANGAPQTILEVTEVSYSTPPDSLFDIPANCAAAAAAPRIPTEAETIAALTGDDPKNFVKAIYGPGSANSCTMLFRVLKAGSMEPIISGFQVALDLNQETAPSYTIGLSSDGHSTFSGGGLREVTSQLQNGQLRIDDIPEHFNLELTFGEAGSSSALIYRQCFAPQTTLLYLLKNPEKISDGGDWLWVKSGKYATGAH
jgi:hypothetical protein